MTTIYRKHIKDRPFTCIENDTIKDPDLSWKATGLLVYLLSLPADWSVNNSDLQQRKIDGVGAVKSAMKELQRAGYVIREKERSDDGTITRHIVNVFEEPTSISQFSTSGFSTSGESTTTKERPLENNETTKGGSSRLVERPNGEWVELENPESEDL